MNTTPLVESWVPACSASILTPLGLQHPHASNMLRPTFLEVPCLTPTIPFHLPKAALHDAIKKAHYEAYTELSTLMVELTVDPDTKVIMDTSGLPISNDVITKKLVESECRAGAGDILLRKVACDWDCSAGAREA